MHRASALAAFGFDADALARARAEGHVVGRGEGFVSREWRDGSGRVLAVHTDADDRELACAHPLLAGLGWEPWQLVSVTPGRGCLHCATAQLRQDAVELVAALPDYAARRRMLPAGLAVQASVVVAVDDWRPGESLASFVSAVIASGRVVRAEPVAPGSPITRCRIERGGQGLWLAGRAGGMPAVGDELVACGHAIVRIGAPLARRGADTPPKR